MTKAALELLEQALRLPPEERIKLAEKLYDSVGDDDLELTPEWREEIERRVARVESGAAGPGIPLDEAMARIRGDLEEHRKKRGQGNPA